MKGNFYLFKFEIFFLKNKKTKTKNKDAKNFIIYFLL